MANPIISTPNASFGGGSSAASAGGSSQSSLTPSDETTFEQKYNQIPHVVELYLENSGVFNGQKRYPINPAAVLSLSIQDSILDWVVRGSLAFLFLPDKHSGNAGGSSTGNRASTATSGAIQNNATVKNYQFRADGFDLLRVAIRPAPKKSTASKANTNKSGTILVPEFETENDAKWNLSYLFSITDIEDISKIKNLKGPLGAYMKCYKLYFEDVRYHILRNTNLEYSTALNPTANFQNQLANQGSLFTGDAMLEVFNAALTNPEAGGSEAYRITGVPPAAQAQQSGSESTPAASVWDKGFSEIFYTSPAQYSAEDDIDYLFSHHVSEVPLLEAGGFQGPPSPDQPRDICLLHTERSTSPQSLEKISLSPLSTIFQKAGKGEKAPGPLQYEHFFLTGQSHLETGAKGLFGAPISETVGNIDIKTSKYGQILSYSFVDMSPIINSQKFITRPVYSVEVGKRQFNIEFTNNDVLAARKFFSGSYIDQLYSLGEAGQGEQLFLNQLHTSKKSLNVFPIFSLNGDNKVVRQKNSLHQLLYTNLFQSTCICFTTLGLTMRESGTFIGIDQTKGFTVNDYNTKLFGQYFVVKVEHSFEGGLYINTIHAVKVHRVKALIEPFENILAGGPSSTTTS